MPIRNSATLFRVKQRSSFAVAIMSAMARQPAHIVRLDRKGKFACDTLAADSLAELQSLYKAQPWYTDKLSRKPFRQRILELSQRDKRGFVVLGPGMSFDPPPPFLEFFEPIQLGTNDPQMVTLSGAKPTRQETAMKVLIALGVLAAIGGLIPLLIALLRGQIRAVSIIVIATAAILVLIAALIYVIQRVAARWFLLPAAVAIRSRIRPKDPLVLLTPLEAAAILRWVSNGKTSMLMLELWRADGKSWRRAVSEREAMSFLAAWRSDEIAPPAEQLEELLTP